MLSFKCAFVKSLFNTALDQKCCLTYQFSKLFKIEFRRVCLSCVLLLYKISFSLGMRFYKLFDLGSVLSPQVSTVNLRKGVACVHEGDSMTETDFLEVSQLRVQCA